MSNRGYPDQPGFKFTDTSREAADAMGAKARSLRTKVLDVLRGCGPLTADECAARLGETILAIRPRLTELKVLGLIEDAGTRRRNTSGRRAIVWRKKP